MGLCSNGLPHTHTAISPTRHIFGSTIAHIPTLTQHPTENSHITNPAVRTFYDIFTDIFPHHFLRNKNNNCLLQIHLTPGAAGDPGSIQPPGWAMMSHGHGGVLLRDVFAFAGGQRLKGLRIYCGWYTDRHTRILDSSILLVLFCLPPKKIVWSQICVIKFQERIGCTPFRGPFRFFLVYPLYKHYKDGMQTAFQSCAHSLHEIACWILLQTDTCMHTKL